MEGRQARLEYGAERAVKTIKHHEDEKTSRCIIYDDTLRYPCL